MSDNPILNLHNALNATAATMSNDELLVEYVRQVGLFFGSLREQGIDTPADAVVVEADYLADMEAGFNKAEELQARVTELEGIRDREIAINNDLLAERKADKARIAELKTTVDKLPVYADTGKPFMPGPDKAWCVVGGDVIDAHLSELAWDSPYGCPDDDFRWMVLVDDRGWSDAGPFYSTYDAALAARSEQGGG